MTRDAGLRVFSYDAENMLRKAVNSAGALVADYDYYGDGTRSFKRAVWGGATTESRFFYDGSSGGGAPGDQEVLETDNASGNDLGANAVLRRYLRLPGSIDEPFVMIDYTLPANDNERWAHQNRLGSVVAVTGAAGALKERHTYSPYGVAGINNAGFPFRFTGQKLDPETGLYYYKARYYDPETGRFLQTDPIGYEDQMNLYAYVGNDPINATDPTGKQCFPDHPEGGTGGDGTPGRQCGNEPTAEDFEKEERKQEERRQEEERQRQEEEQRKEAQSDPDNVQEDCHRTVTVGCFRARNPWVIGGCEVVGHTACRVGRLKGEEEKERREEEEEEDDDE